MSVHPPKNVKRPAASYLQPVGEYKGARRGSRRAVYRTEKAISCRFHLASTEIQTDFLLQLLPGPAGHHEHTRPLFELRARTEWVTGYTTDSQTERHSAGHIYGQVVCMDGVWPVSAYQWIREIDIIWNNRFRRVFNCCWRESVKPLKFYCRTLPISYLIGERQLLFYRRLLCTDKFVLAGPFEMLVIAAKYEIKSMHFSTATVKNAVWTSFVNAVKF